ncbi:hypothetical protein MFC_01430 [Mesomycoplasma flocculare ATCC 27716]|nr:hypothetical protein MFC_01430 [Mesomycoplasma flocculare ATCC 27716]
MFAFFIIVFNSNLVSYWLFKTLFWNFSLIKNIIIFSYLSFVFGNFLIMFADICLCYGNLIFNCNFSICFCWFNLAKRRG